MTESFQAYAVELLDQQTKSLKDIYRSQPVSAKQLKLKAFNEHLDTLKQKMQAQMKLTLSEAREAGADINQLSIKLMGTYNAVINEFFTKDFNEL